MKKQYNNLNMENLIKTSWFKKFNQRQQEQIIFGLLSRVDILIYAKKEFEGSQMREIRKGLKDNLDVSTYINPKLKANLDVLVYAKPEISWQEMEEIRLKLLKEKLGSSYSPSLL